tara:strand:- start:228 stop:638 length:411 start_codon:yes stop_codon:yes gene_type:complete
MPSKQKKYLTISNNFYYNGKLFKAQEQYDLFKKVCSKGGGCGCGKPKSSTKNQTCVWEVTVDGKKYTLPEDYAIESQVKLDTEPPNSDVFQDVFNEGRGIDSKKSNMYHDLTEDYRSVQHRNSPGAIRYAANHIKM